MKSPLGWVASAPQLSDAEQVALARAANAGDRKAADKLMRSVAQALLTLSTRLSFRTGLGTDDLFAAAMFGAYEWLPRFKEDGGMSVTAWCVWHGRSRIRELVRNTFKNNRRFVASIEATIEDDADEFTSEEEESADAAIERVQTIQETKRAVDAALKESSRVERVAIRGRFYEEKTYAQLGKQVGRTRYAMSMAEKRVLAKIKKRLR